MKKLILNSAFLLAALAVFAYPNGAVVAQSGGDGPEECVTCQPEGCYENAIGVFGCEAELCGAIWPCGPDT